jgi:glycosyltransferase involved in cell wall biosynthesis
MKLIVQIPCFNEAETLPRTLADIPRQIAGVDEIEVLVIDDGSTDGTAGLARTLGVDHVVRHKTNMGLARSFRTGVETGLALGADIIVNTDGDNQYAGADIPRLIAPILAGEADIVVGDRQTATVAHFSRGKKLLQKLGSFAVRQFSHTDVPDAVSGFRAVSRKAALQLNIVSSFSYTIEMLIQAGRKQIAITSVPVGTNASTRKSRLFKSIPGFIGQSLVTMVRMYAMYRPLRVFFYLGLGLALTGALPILRFVYLYLTGDGDGHVQSLVLGGVLVVIGFVTLLIGLVADLVNFNRQLIEMTLEKVRRLELARNPGRAGDTRNRKDIVEQIAELERQTGEWADEPLARAGGQGPAGADRKSAAG